MVDDGVKNQTVLQNNVLKQILKSDCGFYAKQTSLIFFAIKIKILIKCKCQIIAELIHFRQNDTKRM